MVQVSDRTVIHLCTAISTGLFTSRLNDVRGDPSAYFAPTLPVAHSTFSSPVSASATYRVRASPIRAANRCHARLLNEPMLDRPGQRDRDFDAIAPRARSPAMEHHRLTRRYHAALELLNKMRPILNALCDQRERRAVRRPHGSGRPGNRAAGRRGGRPRATATGGRRAAGGGRPAAGGRRAAGSGRRAVGSGRGRWLAVGGQPATGHGRPATGDRRPAAGHGRPATGHTGHGRPATGHGPRATGHGPRATGGWRGAGGGSRLRR